MVASVGHSVLTHLPLDKMAAISQTIFSGAFSWMKSFIFWLKFHWSLFIRANWQYLGIGLDNGLAPNRRQAIIWTNVYLIHWRKYATLGGDELIKLEWYHMSTPSGLDSVPVNNEQSFKFLMFTWTRNWCGVVIKIQRECYVCTPAGQPNCQRVNGLHYFLDLDCYSYTVIAW